MSEATPTVEVAAGLIVRDGKILIAQRLNNAHLGGLWEFPGGKRQSNESLEACLQREIMEELGVAVAVYERVVTAEHHDLQCHIRLYFFRCAVLTGDPRPLGCQAFRWVTPMEIAAYPFPPADLPLVRQIASGRHIIA